MKAVIRRANQSDLPKMMSFLKQAMLGVEGVAESIEYFILMEDQEGRIKATIGIQPVGECGLLRSLVMTEGMNEKDLFFLIEQIFVLAKDRNMKSLYMATKENSIHLFTMLGFIQVVTKDLPEQLKNNEHIQHLLSVDNSCFMSINL
jgi:N-acetylglutamate synthase-like GNAT family acetyltransferase